jgi:hypothetical protein
LSSTTLRRSGLIASAFGVVAVSLFLAGPAYAGGYSAYIELPHAKGGPGIVIASQSRVSILAEFGLTHSVLYEGPARVSRKRVLGRLGRFGRISLHFDPSGRPRRSRVPRRCVGSPRVILEWMGTFTGSVRFAPESGHHLSFRDRSFHGVVRSSGNWDCKPDFEELFPFDPDAGGVDVIAASCDGRSFTVRSCARDGCIRGRPRLGHDRAISAILRGSASSTSSRRHLDLDRHPLSALPGPYRFAGRAGFQADRHHLRPEAVHQQPLCRRFALRPLILRGERLNLLPPYGWAN